MKRVISITTGSNKDKDLSNTPTVNRGGDRWLRDVRHLMVRKKTKERVRVLKGGNES